MDSTSIQLCPDELVQDAAAAAGRDDGEGLARTDQLLAAYPEDPRLNFLKGSLLAALRRYGEAEGPLALAVRAAPGFHIARFQLGFLQLTSGDADAALSSWGPLLRLPGDAYLRLFVEGLQHAIRDEFAEAEHKLRLGMANNTENPPLNRDMQLMIDGMLAKGPPGPAGDGGDEASSVHWLLQEYQSRRTRH